MRADEPLGFLILFFVGAIASGINAVAGGGSLISFPTLTVLFRIPELPANATNSVALWPGSLAGAFGFLNQIQRTKHHLKTLLLPTLLGALLGAELLIRTTQRTFELLVPLLILLAAVLLVLQPKVKKLAQERASHVPVWVGIVMQFLVAIYGGYFGAGMGIMMLAAFALTMEGTIHELNAVKSWLGLVINLVASIRFFTIPGLLLLWPAVALTLGAIVGGFAAARISQKVDGEKLRVGIAAYGFVMAAVFAYRALG